MKWDYSSVKVGDIVWWADVNRKGLVEGVVTKIGSKLITVDNDLVFRKDTGLANDKYGDRTLIPDKDLYEEELRANRAMYALGKRITYSRNPGVTYADIVEAAKLLKIDLEEEK